MAGSPAVLGWPMARTAALLGENPPSASRSNLKKK